MCNTRRYETTAGKRSPRRIRNPGADHQGFQGDRNEKVKWDDSSFSGSKVFIVENFPVFLSK